MARPAREQRDDPDPGRDRDDGRLRLLPRVPVGPAIAPVVAADDRIGPETDALLSGLARRAAAGDLRARDALWFALGPKVARFLQRYRRFARSAGGDRDGLRWLDYEDLSQSTFLVFAEVLASWDGAVGFGTHFVTVFPWRLSDAWRRAVADARPAVRLHPVHSLVEDPTAVAAEARSLAAALAADLGDPDGTILRLHLLEDLTLTQVAARLGVGRATVVRRWRGVRAEVAGRVDG